MELAAFYQSVPGGRSPIWCHSDAAVRDPRTRLADDALGLLAGSRGGAALVAVVGRARSGSGRAGGAELRPPAAVSRLRGAALGRPRARAAVGRGNLRLGRGRTGAGGRGAERRPAALPGRTGVVAGAVRGTGLHRSVGVTPTGAAPGWSRNDRPAITMLPSFTSSVST